MPLLPLSVFNMARLPKLFSFKMFAVFLMFLFNFLPSFCLKVETDALLEFKRQINDPLGFLDSWKDSDSPCQFYGVTCDGETGLVIGISLDNKSLSGVISPSLGGLRNLTSLVLPSNQISGSLPGELGKCANLRVLNVSDNYMNGSIPDLSRLSKLDILDLSDNYFSGRFPDWVGNLTALVSLGLGGNEYDEGEIPENLGNLKNLYWLYLADSNLRGEIPESIFELEALGTLDICKNQISGDFPRSISKLQNLFKIELYTNNLTGEIPPELANLTLLEEFDVSNNQMHGKIPLEIGNLKKLTVFHLFKNNFSGEIPPAFADMQHLIAFSIYRNRFSGEFPPKFGRFSPLNSIDISENKFSGGFPKYLCQNRNLQNLLALENYFSGPFPDTYAECKTLVRLRINGNQFDGTLPDGIWALPNAQVIDFSDNGFTGAISPEIGASLNLNELILTNNKFSGEIPRELARLIELERIYMDKNVLSEKIPPELGALKQISSIHLEENQLTGPIPPQLAECCRLAELNLASNSLTGAIPKTFSMMSSLNSLNLSRNELDGSIPESLGKLKLSLLDLSYNQLSGSVPSDILSVANEETFTGNKGLCAVESTKRSAKSGLGHCGGKDSEKPFLSKKLFILCVILLSLVVVIGGLLLVSYLNFKRRVADSEKYMGDERGVHPKWKLESFHQVQFDVDEICDLDDENLIGSGSTGKVYRVDLKKGCGTVAVKQLWKGNNVKLFAAEMEILGKIRHRNILKLYACLMKGGSNLLVFEYMANGNLFEALHREIKGGRPELDWQQRYKIALGAAKGIAYLHHDCYPPVIHRDIKSTNILLDEEYEAKIADFGVAKMVEITSPRGSERSSFAGTHGYMAPELAYSLKVTEKSDIFSFGIVLLELLTGRKPIEEAYGEGKDIVYWVSTHLNDPENVVKVLDNKVMSDLIKDDMVKVLKIATLCTAKLPNIRPSMREVVKLLTDVEPSIFKSPGKYEKNEKVFL